MTASQQLYYKTSSPIVQRYLIYGPNFMISQQYSEKGCEILAEEFK